MSLKYDYILKKMRLSDKTDSLLPYHEITTTTTGKNNNISISGFNDVKTNPDGWKLDEQTEPSIQFLSVLNTISNIKSGAILKVWQTKNTTQTLANQTLLNQRIYTAENLDFDYQRTQIINNGTISWGEWYETNKDENIIQELNTKIQTLEQNEEDKQIKYQIGIAYKNDNYYQTQKFDIVKTDYTPSIDVIPYNDKNIKYIQLLYENKYNNQYGYLDILDGYLINVLTGAANTTLIQLIIVPIVLNDKTIIRYYYRTATVSITGEKNNLTDFKLYENDDITQLYNDLQSLDSRVTDLDSTVTDLGSRVVDLEVNPRSGKDGQDGQDGEDGQDGITPQLRSIDNENTHEIQVSYDNGETFTTLTTIQDGQDGEDGQTAEAQVPIVNLTINNNNVTNFSVEINNIDITDYVRVLETDTAYPVIVYINNTNTKSIGTLRKTMINDVHVILLDFTITEYSNGVTQQTVYKLLQSGENGQWGNWTCYKAELKDSNVMLSKTEAETTYITKQKTTDEVTNPILNHKFIDDQDNRTNTVQITSVNDYGNSNGGYLSLENFDNNLHGTWIRLKSSQVIQLCVYDNTNSEYVTLDLNASKLKKLQQLLTQ